MDRIQDGISFEVIFKFYELHLSFLEEFSQSISTAHMIDIEGYKLGGDRDRVDEDRAVFE